MAAAKAPVARKHAGRGADEGPSAVPPVPVGGCVFDGHQHGSALLAAEEEPLDESQRHQQRRSPHADLLVGGQQADRGRAHAGDAERDDQHELAADEVAEVTDHRRAERAGQESRAEGRERQQRPHPRITGGEEQLVEHQTGRGAVDQEVVELDGVADSAGEGRLAHGGLVRVRDSDGHPTSSFARGRRPPEWSREPQCIRAGRAALRSTPTISGRRGNVQSLSHALGQPGRDVRPTVRTGNWPLFRHSDEIT